MEVIQPSKKLSEQKGFYPEISAFDATVIRTFFIVVFFKDAINTFLHLKSAYNC